MSFLSKRASKAKFHIIGIGGIGMSGIAEILNSIGFLVQGSDLSGNSNTDRLSKLGLKIFIGHKEDNIIGADYVVISSSVKENNIEFLEAKNLNIPIIKRSEMLAEIMKLKTCITISGSHGKTTTTSIVASIFESANLHPTVINGGIINKKSTNAYVGKGEYMIVEADESDATFTKIPSSIGIITNIDPEHLDFYQNFDNLLGAFKTYLLNIPFYGFAVCCIDHENVRKLTSQIIGREIITYGIDSEDADIRAFNIREKIDGSYFSVSVNLPKHSTRYVINDIFLSTPGRHNILNSLAGIAVAAELDLGVKSILNGLSNFKGVKRRFTKTGEFSGITFIDDYAHHPSEIDATLSTAKSVLSNGSKGKLIAVFQPHRYSRLSNLFEDFVKSLSIADEIYISKVYSAGEEKIGDYDHHKLSNEIKKILPNKFIQAFEGEEDVRDIIMERSNFGDLVIFMGAGDITNWAYNIPSQFKSKEIV